MTRWASGALDPKISTSGDVVTSVKRGVWAVIANLQFFLVIACYRPPRRRTTRQFAACTVTPATTINCNNCFPIFFSQSEILSTKP
ncbi:hypothetical protein Peur_052770 [Populus x canadensis]